MSLTVNLKFNVLATELRASDNIPASPPTSLVVLELAKIEANFGKYLEGEAVGLHEMKLGPSILAMSAELSAPVEAPPSSFCSQQYVSASDVLASVADPVSTNGVLIGMV